MYKNILLPIDLDHESSWRPVLPAAIEFARPGGAQLYVMTVAPHITASPGLPSSKDFGQDVPTVDEYNEKMRANAEKRLRAFVADNIPTDLKAKQLVASGSIYRQILRVAREINADLIIMSAYRPSLKSFLLGTNAERVMRHADCSVHVVRP